MWFKYERVTVKGGISILPLFLMLVVAYYAVTNGHTIEGAVTRLFEYAAIVLGVSLVGGIAFFLWYRARSRRRYATAPVRPLDTRQDIKILDYQIYPPAIEPAGTTINGIPIEEYNRERR